MANCGIPALGNSRLKNRNGLFVVVDDDAINAFIA
jgi:hypothetical protein